MDNISRLLSFIPDDQLACFAADTDVNYYAKKLKGELLFKLLLYCLLTEKENSLRGIKSTLEDALFQAMFATSAYHPTASVAITTTIAHSSISERLNVIKPAFFERLFMHCVNKYKATLTKGKQKGIIRFDSTIVSLSTKLLEVGYNLKGGDAEKLRLLKFTVGYTTIPECICLYTEQHYNSENKALKQTIDNHYTATSNDIHVFDRGITNRASYDNLTEKKVSFISRINAGAKHTIHTANVLTKVIETDTLVISSDSWVYLYSEGGKRSEHPVRLIEAVRKADGAVIWFVTNIKKLKPADITGIYKSRWDIELFFKFIKQYLNFSHLLNRTENGIKVIMYVTMIAAILLLQYKKENALQGFKNVKKQFARELEKDIIYHIIVLCGGNPQTAKHTLYKNDS